MKRYWIVAWNDFYPLSGLRNVKARFETLEEARDVIVIEDWTQHYQHCHIFDIENWEECSNV